MRCLTRSWTALRPTWKRETGGFPNLVPAGATALFPPEALSSLVAGLTQDLAVLDRVRPICSDVVGLPSAVSFAPSHTLSKSPGTTSSVRVRSSLALALPASTAPSIIDYRLWECHTVLLRMLVLPRG